MSKFSDMARSEWAKGDKKRDEGLKISDDIKAFYDIPYVDNSDDEYNMLDIYYKKGNKKKLPVIVSIHGGGYVYGTKEVYKYYCSSLAEYDFIVVNFNYHLAPEVKFPNQLIETNMVLQWMVKNADKYYMDLNNVFIVGDSAGAQLASQFCTIYSNEEYARKFEFCIPKEIKINAVALNCGIYDINKIVLASNNDGTNDIEHIVADYLGGKLEEYRDLLDVVSNITPSFPPAYVMTATNDYLRYEAEPMYNLLKEKEIDAVLKVYGEESQEYMGHVFHCNMKLKEAKICNYDECMFFKKYIK